MRTLRSRAEAEIVARHAFFVDWFTGTATDDAMLATARSFAPDFRMVWPDATELDRAPLLDLLRDMRGTKGSDYAIRVEMRHAVNYGDDLILITFDEFQTTGDGPNQRRATALFSSDPGAPQGVVWRHLHQTWITDTDRQ